MLFKTILSLLCVLLTYLFDINAYTNNGKTDLIQWDRSSLVINGTRAFIFSGEFHYPRLPVPELWLDVFQKMRASGFNAVSIYFFWSFHSSSNGTLDFENGAKDIQRLFDYAKETGIWIIARPGPYINAETSAGGLAYWVTTGAYGEPRTSEEEYHQAWLPYITALGKILAKNQYTNGGPVILVQHEKSSYYHSEIRSTKWLTQDSEFVETAYNSNNTRVQLMEQLIAAYDAAGVVVPSSHNEIGMRGMSWSTDYHDVGGAVDIYGLDSYPNGFNCANPNAGFNAVREYYSWFQNVSWTQPSYIPEFQGGSMDSWGGSSYANCALLTGTEFADVFYKGLIGQKISLLSLYMACVQEILLNIRGAEVLTLDTEGLIDKSTAQDPKTAPVVYTSYDYGAPIAESRIVRDKMRQTKLLTLFLRVSRDLRNTLYMGSGTNFTSTTAIYTNHLVNPETNAGFYYLSQATSSSNAEVDFVLHMATSIGLVATNHTLNGRQSKLLVTDYNFGTHALAYSTAEVLTYTVLDDEQILVLYLNRGQDGEFVLKDYTGTVAFYGNGAAATYSTLSREHTKISYTQYSGQLVAVFSNGLRIVLVDKKTAWDFWAPTLTSSPEVEADEHMLVTGPYLVRTLAWDHHNLYLTGDLDASTTLEIFAPATITNIFWNGVVVSFTRTKYSSIITSALAGPTSYTLPFLNSADWRYINSIPEVALDYDDSNWVVANHTTTSNPTKPKALPILYPDDYGFHLGCKLYRGYFTGVATGLTLTIAGGNAFGFSVWVNGVYLGSWQGDAAISITTATMQFTNVSLKSTKNVMTVLHDYNGHDEDSSKPSGARNPRGIIRATLLGSTAEFTQWKLIGNAGGEKILDNVRQPFNEGGLFAERWGFHLPGVDTSSWLKKSPSTGVSGAGVEFYSTYITLDLPSDQDIPLAISLTAASGTIARVQVFINGYQYGKFIPHIGPQTEFPLQPGIVNNKGLNYIALTIWSQDSAGAKVDVELVALGQYTTGYATGFQFDAEYLQPAYSNNRAEYA